jgi:hypothetical protein
VGIGSRPDIDPALFWGCLRAVPIISLPLALYSIRLSHHWGFYFDSQSSVDLHCERDGESIHRFENQFLPVFPMAFE